MSKQCTKCSLSNPPNSLFCNHCGHELDIDIQGNDSQLYNKALSEECQRIHDNFKREINEEALELKFGMLEEFQEKATRWAKVQFATLTTAIAIVTAVLGYVGYNSSGITEKIEAIQKETKKSVQETQNKMDKSIESTLAEFKAQRDTFTETAESTLINLESKRKHFNDKVSKAEKMIEEKTEELSRFNSDQIEKYEINLLKAKKKNEVLATKLNAQVSRIDAQIENIKKLENSRFHILVHYREKTQKLYQKNIDQLEKILFKKGFILNNNSIANVRSDRQEILYYSESIHIKDKIKEIQRLLSSQFNNIPIHFESAGSFDPLQVVIKLCPQGNDSDGYCTIEKGNEDK